MSCTTETYDRAWNAIVDDLTRRQFGMGTATAGIAAFLASCSSAQTSEERDARETRTVTTPDGTFEIPAAPTRVIAIDSRLDLEPAVALELPIVGYTYAPATPWVPVDSAAPFLDGAPNLERLLALAPDLIICSTGYAESLPYSDLATIAPVLTTDFTLDWRANLDRLAGWLGRTATLDKLIGDYDTLIGDIRTRHRAMIESTKVASISYLPDTSMLYITSIRTSLKGDKPSDMSLFDIGGTSLTVPGIDGQGGITAESIDLLNECDGFMVTEEPDSAAYRALAENPLWQRLPAVQAGHVTTLGGSTYYGSLYTNTYVARGWDALYTKMS
ncbi:ABC transporter substrate-binding protein [Rhodococcus sp. C3V]|uniref:ABC transporter substrate-binding protein n=1 Tax=Rhodococcus sp. C3V TaxID=3034165 RepID=UPI0023E304B7|nr:ABC transporter substrate-binding protein [Rhodococcus sp. C3V]MDF3319701.1 ABC transporter substrate-binding protein [Rhodococcus sp. C3V]